MKRYLLLLLLLFPFYVKAVDGYTVYIEDDNIQVKLNNEIVSDYSNIVEYNNRVLTVKEGAYINCIYFNDIDLTVTSNNKVAYINYINHGNYQLDPNIHKTLTIRDYRNDENTPWSFYVNVYYSKIEVYNSVVYKLDSFHSYDHWENIEASLTIKDSKISGSYGTLHPSGPIYLENVDFDGGYIQSENSHLIIKNCNLNMRGNLYNDSGDGYIEIYDSNLILDEYYSTINVHNYSDNPEKDYALIIKNSNINGGRTYLSTRSNLPTYIENSTMNNNIEQVDGVLYIKNSNINMNSGRYGVNYHGMVIENSTVSTNSHLQNNEGINTIIRNSSLNVGGKYTDFNDTLIDSSSVEAGVIYLIKDTTINNSYIKAIRPSGIDFSIRAAVVAQKKLSMNNSYLFAKVVEDDMYPLALLQNDFSYDNNLMVTDENGTPLKLVFDDDAYVYSYDTNGNSLPNTVTLRAKANVTFKIVNGTWADGSIDDIVITKDVWDTLNPEDIPELPELPGGHWEIIPTTSDYIKGDVTYVYVIDKQVKGVEENPKTGISNIFTVICLLLAITLTVIYNKHLNKTYFMKG